MWGRTLGGRGWGGATATHAGPKGGEQAVELVGPLRGEEQVAALDGQAQRTAGQFKLHFRTMTRAAATRLLTPPSHWHSTTLRVRLACALPDADTRHRIP